MSFQTALKNAAVTFGISMTDQQIIDFNVYYRLLIEWNQKFNLTAITEPGDVAVKHMIDSLSCYDTTVFATGCSMIDVGAGAGFPSIPLKIMYPSIQITLLDSLNKRVGFLNTVIAELKLDGIEAVHSRAEDGARNRHYRECYDIAVARAVAKLNVLSELCLPFVKVGGHFIALKGAQVRQEVEQAQTAIAALGGAITEIKTVKLPDYDDIRAVIYINKKKATPARYPRKPGLLEKKPL